MLQLKRVELQGFKSFADRSEMRFHGSGLAAIVGPNGCGKSNLSDAISWVLGEQSAKSLRGANMQDVIFAGTSSRKPVGLAQVTLTLVDPNASEATHGHPSEVTITRRLYRSGESEYLVNGKSSRLRDIQDLFMGTGLGPESYAIIEQGRIGQILSNKPQDRRNIIEEAAGITRFKMKRRLAEAKLESAKGNLTRVYDILEEVSRQVASLKRQAAKARRYEELRADLVENLRIALTGRYKTLEREATGLALDLNQATADHARLTEAVAEKETARAQAQAQCFTLEEQLREARRILSEQRVEAERTRGKLDSQTTQAGNIEQRLTRGDSEAQQLNERVTELEAELAQQTQHLTECEQALSTARASAQAAEQQRQAAQQKLRERTQAIEQGRQAVLRLMDEASRLRNQLASADEFLSSVDRDAARSTRDAEVAQGDLARLEQSIAQSQQRHGEVKTEVQALLEARRGCEGMLSERRNQLQQLRREWDQAKTEVGRLRARLDSLSDVLAHHSYSTGAVKQIFEAVGKGRTGELKPIGVLADFLEAETGYEKVAEEFLAEELEYVVVDGWNQAEQGIQYVRNQLQGKATFLLHHSEGAAEVAAPGEESIRNESGVIAKLTDVLKLNNGFHGHSLRMLPRLANCYLVDTPDTAQRLASNYAQSYFLLPDGASYHGLAVTGGKKTGAGPLAIKREMREAQSTLTSKQHYADSIAAQVEKVEHELQELTAELERLRNDQQAKERDVHTLDVELRKFSEERQRAQQLLHVAHRELDRLKAQREKAEQSRQQNSALLEQKDKAKTEQEAHLSELQRMTVEAEAALHQINEESAALRADLAGTEERRRSAQSAKSRVEQQHREVAQRRHALSEEMNRLREQQSRIANENAALTQRATELQAEIASNDAKVQQLAHEEEQARTTLTLADELLKQLRSEFQAAQDKKGHLEVALVKAQGELKYLDETCQKDLKLPVAELAANVEIIPTDEELAAAQARADEVRSKIDNLGPVNAQALEEYEESQQRYNFLAAQRQDLLDSIRDTEKAITEIDGESRRRFAEAFEVINTNFREMFKILFNGGVGEMRLTNPDNLIESGIDIVAQPPNKKLQNVLLLSGGEKALTAMALLMAIFKYQPSPFCILDEVDAPLDEPNTERLNRLITEMSKTTQFVVITHAKRTMEAAQVMYGVTMQEPGISKLVSVKFNHPDPVPGAVLTQSSTPEPVVVQ